MKKKHETILRNAKECKNYSDISRKSKCNRRTIMKVLEMQGFKNSEEWRKHRVEEVSKKFYKISDIMKETGYSRKTVMKYVKKRSKKEFIRELAYNFVLSGKNNIIDHNISIATTELSKITGLNHDYMIKIFRKWGWVPSNFPYPRRMDKNRIPSFTKKERRMKKIDPVYNFFFWLGVEDMLDATDKKVEIPRNYIFALHEFFTLHKQKMQGKRLTVSYRSRLPNPKNLKSTILNPLQIE